MTLDTNKFVDGLIDKGYSHLCVVPCSFAKNLINSVINNDSINYVPCASEAVACSVASGLKMSSQKPIVVVQSSGLTNMGSCITSLLKPYDITFPILTSWRTYKDGDSEIQHKHLATELPKLIEAYGYDHLILDKDDLGNALNQIDKCDSSFTIGVIKKDSFESVSLKDEHKLDLSAYLPRSEFLKLLNNKFKDNNTLFIGTTGNTAREMYSFMPDTNNFYMAGNMGGALSLGLGASMGNKNVIVCGGDAEFVMHLGGLSTAGRYANDVNLIYVLFDNEANKSTGGQNTYQKHIDYINIAKNSNCFIYEKEVLNLEEFDEAINLATSLKSLSFIHVKCGFDDETPRPPLNIVKVKEFKK